MSRRVRVGRLAQGMSIETLGKLVLVVLVAIGVIIFIVVGINTQVGAYNNTGTTIIGNLSDAAHQAGGNIIS